MPRCAGSGWGDTAGDANGDVHLTSVGMQREPRSDRLDGIVLPDVRTGDLIDLAAEQRALVTLIRHRY